MIVSVAQVKPLTATIMQVFLQLPQALPYLAGQYLEVILNTGTPREQRVPLSIANAALGATQLELHIRHAPENAMNNALLQEIQQSGIVHIAVPFGQCTYLSLKPNLPVIFMARGSGFSPIKAIIEQLLANGSTLSMHLYWGARNKGDQYLDMLPKQWADHVDHFAYTPLLCNDNSDELIQKILDDHSDLSQHQILAAGPFDMIFKARDMFQQYGLKLDNMYSDAFDFVV